YVVEVGVVVLGGGPIVVGIHKVGGGRVAVALFAVVGFDAQPAGVFLEVVAAGHGFVGQRAGATVGRGKRGRGRRGVLDNGIAQHHVAGVGIDVD
nr:hypothetical protein [Tanacetum cinerariifolium]